jgi:hypothetical protein
VPASVQIGLVPNRRDLVEDGQNLKVQKRVSIVVGPKSPGDVLRGIGLKTRR